MTREAALLNLIAELYTQTETLAARVKELEAEKPADPSGEKD